MWTVSFLQVRAPVLPGGFVGRLAPRSRLLTPLSSPLPPSVAVWICSPSQYHADQIKACAANGKDVFCEKPIATDLAATVEAINSCNEAGVKLMIGLQRRFDPNFLRVKEAIEKKEVGDPIVVSTAVAPVFFLAFSTGRTRSRMRRAAAN